MPLSYPVSSSTSWSQEASGVAGSSRASFIHRFKDVYLPKWDDHVHTKVKLASLIAKKKGTMGGTLSLGSVLSQLPGSAGFAVTEGATWPTPTASSGFNPRILSRHIGARLRWTVQVENAARAGDKAAWASPRREEMEAARKRFDKNFQRMLYQGPQQILGRVSSVSSGVYTLQSRNGRAGGALNTRYNYGAHYFEIGDPVVFLDGDGTNVLPMGATEDTDQEKVVVAKDNSDPTAPTITIGDPGTTSASDYSDPPDNASTTLIIPYGSRSTSAITEAANSDALMYGPNGLLNLAVNSGRKTYVYGVSRSTYPTLAAFAYDNSGTVRAWDERFIHLAINQTQDDGTGDDPDKVLMHSSVVREYVRETQGDRRFDPVLQEKGSKNLAFTASDVNLPIMQERDCPPGLAFILDTTSFGWMSEFELQMIDDGDRFVANQAAHEVMLMKSGNEVCMKPSNCALVEDIAYSATGLTA